MDQRMVACAAALLFLSSVPGLFAAPPERSGKANFSKLVVVGDSLAAGVENDSLVDFQQEHGFAKVIARQMHVPLSLPLVPYPGAPNTLDLVDPSFPPVIQPVPGFLVFPRLNPFEEVTDVAVPLQTVSDALNRKPNRTLTSTDETQLATNLVLGFPCPVLIPCPARTQVQQAVALHPTAILIDIGNNDILAPVSSGQLASILTSPMQQQAFFTQFATNYGLLLQQLSAANAPFIIGNLPDVLETAFFIPVPKLAAELKLPVSDVTTLLGVNATDFITLSALPKVEAIVTNQVQGPLPASCSATATPAPCVVTAQEAAAARAAVMQLNQIIAAEAAPYHAVVVDLFHLIDQLYVNGYTVGNRTLTADFLGGLFSLDGIHPTNTGYAIMANEFIKAINQAFDLNVRSANVREVAEHDPLVLNKPFWRRFR